MTLEDEATDIVQKAARGLGKPIPPHSTHDELRAAAQTLNLNAAALIAIADDHYNPEVPCPDFLTVVATAFGDMMVNAYRIGSICFDTGADASGLLASASPEALFITHHHPDHIADLAAFEGTTIHAPTNFPLSDKFTFGDIAIEARPTPGHSKDGTTYVITGLDKTIAIVGDALFAGSMGGPNISYQQCLEGARRQILALPDDAILCPGHGPLTTVALEKMNNPFFA